MGEKILYVHAGLHKTGTTSIQYFCWINNAAFAGYGYCYPDLGFRYKGKSFRRNGTFLTQPYIDENGNKVPEKEPDIFRQGMDQIDELFDKYDRIILSDEGIFRNTMVRKPDLWKDLKSRGEARGYTVKMIVYLRRQDELEESFWNQQIKHEVNYHTTWDKYISNSPLSKSLDYYDVLEKISNAIGKENVIVRRFGSYIDGTLQEDFLNVIDLSLDDSFDFSEEIKKKNQRLSLNILEMKRIVNECQNPKTVKFVERALLQSSIKNQGKETVFPTEDAERFLSSFEDGNNRVAEEYIGDGKPLFEDYKGDLPVWNKENPNTVDDLVRFQTAVLDAVLTENAKLKDRVKKLEKSVKLQKQRHFRMLDVLKHPWKIFKKGDKVRV